MVHHPISCSHLLDARLCRAAIMLAPYVVPCHLSMQWQGTMLTEKPAGLMLPILQNRHMLNAVFRQDRRHSVLLLECLLANCKENKQWLRQLIQSLPIIHCSTCTT